MNNFFKIFLASLLAIVVSFTLLFVVSIVIALSASSLLSDGSDSSSGPILTINFNEQITDSPISNPLSLFDATTFEIQRSISMSQLLEGLEKSSIDPNISAIFMDLSATLPLNMAQLVEIRNALKKVKDSGKPIYCYSDYYSQASYFLASVADKIYTSELGSVEIKGLSSQIMFFKGTLDKLGVKPEIIRHGQFKSAIEPFTSDKMSPANRAQTTQLISSIWDYMLTEISSARKIEKNEMENIAKNLLVGDSKDALKYNLVDTIAYKSGVKDDVAKMVGEQKFKDISLYNYINSATTPQAEYSQNKVAVIYADGEIVSASSGAATEIVSCKINNELIKAAADSTIKSVVLRINSPGGSAIAADNIWKEVKSLRDKKPVIVSMGGSAASGGYYIAAPADLIIAEPTTITGSIGVFGLMFNIQDGLKDKLGVTVDGVGSYPSSDMGSMVRPLTPTERNYIQTSIDNTYNIFVEKVAEGRNLSVEQVDKIAQGRVWSGIDAIEIGLVDAIGGLSEAIAIAADRAGVADSFRIYTFTEKDDLWSEVVNSLLVEVKTRVAAMSKTSKIESSIALEYEKLKRYMSSDKIQATMPFTINIF